MIKTSVKKDLKQLTADLLCVYVLETGKKIEDTAKLDKPLQKKITDSIKTYAFQGKSKEILVLEGIKNFKRILLMGLGKKKPTQGEEARQLLYDAVKQANILKVGSLAAFVPGSAKLTKEAVEGIELAAYQFKGMHKKEDKSKNNTLKSVTLISDVQESKTIIDEVTTVSQAVNMVKDMVNLPANVVTPSYLVKEATAIAKISAKANLKVLSVADAKKLKMGAFLGVAKGAKEPAKVIVLNYKGAAKTKPTYAVIGKGITFDSGGISLKPASGMDKMKTDMAGAAAALGVAKAVIQLGLKVNLLTIVPTTENMPGGDAIHPGDILTAANGKTIEIISTDAEGRLILADALVHAQNLGASKIIDLATLTGACLVTFGNVYTALMSNNSDWTNCFMKAAGISGEKTWELPMDKAFNKALDSEVADMKNGTEDRKAGTIAGAKFLERFVEKNNAWIHLDIAGSSYQDAANGYLDKHASGIPVRTIIELLKAEEKA